MRLSDALLPSIRCLVVPLSRLRVLLTAARERRRLRIAAKKLGYVIAHLCAWRAVAEGRKDWEAACQAAKRLGPDPWPALLASQGLPAPGYLTAENWKDILVGLCDGYFGALPSALTAAIDAGAPLSALVRVGLETGYVAPDTARSDPVVEQQRLKMQQELQNLSDKRREETLAFAKSMMTGIETNQLGPDPIDLLAEILSRPGRPVSGREEVIGTLRCLLNDPDYLRPHFDSLESEWEYETLSAQMVGRDPSACISAEGP